ncbi:MAG TPA: hypothetical protein PK948_08680 [Gemmatimonadales bacterium]|nr:hypothetical protein [Gemmatimonadales bacterium]
MAPVVCCAACGTLSEGPFCSQCGAPMSGDAGPRRERRAWVVAGLLSVAAVAAVLALVLRGAPEAVVPAMGNVGSQAADLLPPAELAALPPRERFNRVFDRMMRAGAEGDSTTVATLSSIALAAYADIDSVDADARFHAGLIAIQTGDFPGALAVADTLERQAPGHLFGPILIGAVAGLEHDSTALRRAFDLFRARADRELARTDRPEYLEHRQLLTQFQQAAETQ